MIDRLFLILSGILLIALSLAWDLLRGLPSDFGLPQAVMMAIGFFILLLGIQPSKVVRINFYVLCILAVVALIVLELFVPSRYSRVSIRSAVDFDSELDSFNSKVVFSKNALELESGDIKNEFVTRNKMGFVYKKTENTKLSEKSGFRIVVLGDSFVMGDGMAWGGTWDAIAINYLEYLAPEVEMISFGRNGATTNEQFKFLMSNIDAINPDLVVFSFVSNDPHFREKEITKTANRIEFIEANAKLTGYPYPFKSINFVYERVKNLFVSYYPYYGYEGWEERLYEKENFDEYKQLLALIKSASAENDFDVSFYIFPSISYQSAAHKNYLKLLLDALDENQLRYINPLSHFNNAIKFFPGSYLKANPGDSHPGMLTNYLAVRYFISNLCDTGVLPEECAQYRLETMDSN